MSIITRTEWFRLDVQVFGWKFESHFGSTIQLFFFCFFLKTGDKDANLICGELCDVSLSVRYDFHPRDFVS